MFANASAAHDKEMQVQHLYYVAGDTGWQKEDKFGMVVLSLYSFSVFSNSVLNRVEITEKQENTHDMT